ncbi:MULTISPECIES: response regulator transcription factor [unclassified Streptomyces]|uniref:response regulator transcription factor n=1 Tax=unclassified Streptomyces TaxID=2593676 RepID=UPI0022B637E3|nr:MULTISPECIES: response regulator transcription factor [unclassified Streptomyces]MCZ7415701.1 response regulator transcription factor [Streptomyces sp. WMMC897]MCZ7434488.1 response regulator transcription factor [Streptomyces sp. WMMC1477]
MKEQVLDCHVMDLQFPHRSPLLLDVAVLHEDEVVRRGLENLLEHMNDVGSVRVAPSSAVLGEMLSRFSPDIVLLPASLETPTLRELIRTAQGSGSKVLLLLSAVDGYSVRRASGLAVDGFVQESGLSADTLYHAVTEIKRGEIPVPPDLVRELLAVVKAGERRSRGPQLTPREEEVLALMVQGMSNKQIARRLGISEHGAKRHVSNVLAKLNCPNRTVAAVVAVQAGITPAPAP